MWRRASCASASKTLAISGSDGGRAASDTVEKISPHANRSPPQTRKGGAARRRPFQELRNREVQTLLSLLLALLPAVGLGQDVAAREDQQVLAVDSDLGAAVLRVH